MGKRAARERESRRGWDCSITEGAPRVLPVTFAVADGRIWSAIDRKPKRPGEPARLRFLRRDPRAALTVDRYSDDWDQLAWVQVLGRVSIMEVGEGRPGLEALSAKYEEYREEAPPGSASGSAAGSVPVVASRGSGGPRRAKRRPRRVIRISVAGGRPARSSSQTGPGTRGHRPVIARR